MNLGILKTMFVFLVLCLVQALVLNHIRLFDCATPLLYVYMVLNFRRNYPKAGILLWSFALGLAVDIFSNTPGVAAASLTAIGFIQPYLLEPFIPRDSTDDFKPSLKAIGTASYIYYTIIITLIYSLLFFSLEMFNFFNLLLWAECVAGSTALTVAIIIAIEKVRR